MPAQDQDNTMTAGSTICYWKVVDLRLTAQQNHIWTSCLPLLQLWSQDLIEAMDWTTNDQNIFIKQATCHNFMLLNESFVFMYNFYKANLGVSTLE